LGEEEVVGGGLGGELHGCFVVVASCCLLLLCADERNLESNTYFKISKVNWHYTRANQRKTNDYFD
jgi:hypothetical protein